MDKTERLLRQLDITSDYMGYWCLTIALQIVRDQQLARARVTKDLYPVIAKELQISIDSVERDLRTVLKHSWKARQASMERLGFTACPSPGKFICAVAQKLYFKPSRRSKTARTDSSGTQTQTS